MKTILILLAVFGLQSAQANTCIIRDLKNVPSNVSEVHLRKIFEEKGYTFSLSPYGLTVSFEETIGQSDYGDWTGVWLTLTDHHNDQIVRVFDGENYYTNSTFDMSYLYYRVVEKKLKTCQGKIRSSLK